jgi:hypothetical protein
MAPQNNKHVCIILCILTLQWMSTTTAHTCTLYNTSIGLGADCSRRQLTRVPTDLPSEIVELDMSHNTLGVLRNDTFVHVPNLINLRIRSAFLYYLEAGTFNKLKKLVILDLVYNILRNISKTIVLPLEQLDQLIFDYQRSMTIIDALDLLYGLQGRTMSLLSFTGVVEYHSESHPSVTLKATSFQYLKNICLRNISLSGCSIVMIGRGTFSSFQNKSCLRSLDLSVKVLAPQLSSVFELSALGGLQLFNVCCQGYVYNNGMHGNTSLQLPVATRAPVQIANMTVALPPNLHIVDVSHLPLHGTDITYNIIFINGERVDTLLIQSTPFTSCDAYVYGLPNLTTLDISGWKCMSTSFRFLHTFSNLRILMLGNANMGVTTPYTNSSNICKGLKQLTTMDLSNNGIITADSDFLMYQYKTLTTLSLAGNGFVNIPVPFHKIQKLTSIDLSHNKLSSLTKSEQDGLDALYGKLGSLNVFLAGNVFQCTCKTLDFIEWLNKTHVHFDDDDETMNVIMTTVLNPTLKRR